MPSRDRLLIWAEGEAPVRFAADELARYARRMCPRLECAAEKGGLALAVRPDELAARGCRLTDPALDDAFLVDVEKGKGVIWGSNGLSVLMGAYAFLEACGCRFLRPGEGGEIVPLRSPCEVSARMLERAAHRHRGVVIEGANSLQHVLDMIDFLPKIRMESFFTQFQSIHQFFRRWYEHRNNPLLPAEPITREQSDGFEDVMRQAMRVRGLRSHAVGHGWTCGAVGVEGIDWDATLQQPQEDIKPLLAKINGERVFFHGIPSETNLCYSNPEARRRLIGFVADYLQAHPQIDVAHVWLADGYNNFCQCEDCCSMRPADWYVLVLNELDELLTRRGLSTRIVFLMYLDLLWPPQRQRILHPERFIFMFAPFTRPYGESLAADEKAAMAPFRLDEITLPGTIGENLSYLAAWRQLWTGDSLCFDYYMGRAHYGDLGYMRLSRVIARDIEQYGRLGLNGLLSCQELRCAMPTCLPLCMMGRKLWQPQADTEKIALEWLQAAFGEGWERARVLLESFSADSDIDWWFRGMPQDAAPDAAALEHAAALAEASAAALEEQAPRHEDAAQALSWRILAHHAGYAARMAHAMACRARGEHVEADKAFARTAEWLDRGEAAALAPHMDVYRVLELGKQCGWKPFPSKEEV